MWSWRFRLNSYIVRYSHFNIITISVIWNKNKPKHFNTEIIMSYIFEQSFPISKSLFVMPDTTLACWIKIILKSHVSEEILNWHSLSLSADLCIHFNLISQLRQPIQRKMSQSSALRLSQFKTTSDTPGLRVKNR